jgi:hypothetical protein
VTLAGKAKKKPIWKMFFCNGYPGFVNESISFLLIENMLLEDFFVKGTLCLYLHMLGSIHTVPCGFA